MCSFVYIHADKSCMFSHMDASNHHLAISDKFIIFKTSILQQTLLKHDAVLTSQLQTTPNCETAVGAGHAMIIP